jgi:hypothetical protein
VKITERGVAGQDPDLDTEADNRVRDIQFSPGGRVVVSQHVCGEVWTWSPKTGESLRQRILRVNGDRAAISPDGQLFKLACGTKKAGAPPYTGFGVTVWNIMTGPRIVRGTTSDWIQSAGNGRCAEYVESNSITPSVTYSLRYIQLKTKNFVFPF